MTALAEKCMTLVLRVRSAISNPCGGDDDVPEEDHRASDVQERVPSVRIQRN